MRDIWPMYCGRMQSIRQQVLWQADIIWREKINANDFLRRGSIADPRQRPVQMTSETQEKVEVFQGCINRGLPEPDFSFSDWRERAELAFKVHDEAVAAMARNGEVT